jgi:tetratricopeptide (TPR) repeat protein
MQAKHALRAASLLLLATSVVPFCAQQAATRTDAIALEQQGHTAEAEAAWKFLAAADPRNPEPLAHIGLLESRQEHFAEAADYYAQALALNPNVPGLQMNLGLADFKAGRFADANKAFEAELARHPPEEQAARLTILLGMSHYGMGDYLVAIPYLERAARRDPQSLPLRLTLAHSCLWARQYPCVSKVTQEILTLAPDSAEADMLAGEALDDSGDDVGAIAQFRAAVAANPQEPNANFGLGYLLWKQHHFAEAAPAFQAELALDPAHAQARAYLGDCLVEIADFYTAETQLLQAIQADPKSSMAHRDLGIVYASTSRNDLAVEQLRTAVALNANDYATHWRLAKVYRAIGEKEKSVAEFAIAAKMTQSENDALVQKLSGDPPARR